MWIKNFLASSIGSKALMALTGLMLCGFLLIHLSGNLLLYAGPDAFNAYSHAMQSKPVFLWTARSGLLLAFLLHVAVGIRLSMANRAARPVKYAHEATIQATRASRSMIYTGLLVLAYLLYHLAHFTVHVVDKTEYALDSLGRHDAYKMVIEGFSDPRISGTYIVAMLVVWVHVMHGFSSLWQTLGLRHPKYLALTKIAGPLFATVIVLAFISIPVSVMAGCLKLP